jgi:hypothetical protein
VRVRGLLAPESLELRKGRLKELIEAADDYSDYHELVGRQMCRRAVLQSACESVAIKLVVSLASKILD